MDPRVLAYRLERAWLPRRGTGLIYEVEGVVEDNNANGRTYRVKVWIYYNGRTATLKGFSCECQRFVFGRLCNHSIILFESVSKNLKKMGVRVFAKPDADI